MDAKNVPPAPAGAPAAATPPTPAAAPAGPAPDPRPRGEVLGYTMRGDKNQNPPGMSLWALLREDLRTHESIFAHGFFALAVNRFGNWRMDLPRLVRKPFSWLYEFLYIWCLWFARIEVPYLVKVGRRVRIWHNGGCILGALYLGDDVQVRPNVTLGLAHHGAPLTTLPIIEDRVLLGVNVVVLGPITIGHDSIIAANSVVTTDIPPYSIAGGTPAKVIRRLEERELTTRVNVRESIVNKARQVA
jgi:serine O-acetyltransferase